MIARHLPTAPFLALDMGCGTGVFSRWLASKGAEVTAVDASHDMVAEARRQSDEYSVSYVESELDRFTSPEPFDLVLALSVLEYIRDTDSALDKLAALSKDVLVISVPNRRGAVRRLERAALTLRRLTSGKMFSARGAYLEHQRKQWRPAELDQALLRRGFRRVDHTFVGTAIHMHRDLLPIFEHAWWAALYCGVYQRISAPPGKADRA
jgi:2-polyprenyl-6-hydroxyphenyl methylase/3-demethylubiquinone-9 3-methyltransferase